MHLSSGARGFESLRLRSIVERSEFYLIKIPAFLVPMIQQQPKPVLSSLILVAWFALILQEISLSDLIKKISCESDYLLSQPFSSS